MLCRRIIPFLALLGAVAACEPKPPVEPKRIDEVRPVPPAYKVISYTIQRRDLIASLAKASENSIRLVPVYQNVSMFQSFEHRLFDIKPKSV
jgi:hypothetical protein